MRISQKFFNQLVPAVTFGVSQSVEKAVLLRVFYPIIQIALFFMTECLAIADQEFEITGVGLISGWVVNLVNPSFAVSNS